ncbi:MAG TPA: hypothetical protein VGS58_16450, partial [Candidatus Sulfopaludibacter sp.]|nr:hypothetical protein [Candidatus Sulfopaludibacter sp.]
LANTEGHVQLVLRNSTDQKLTATQGRQMRDLYGSMAPAVLPAAPAVVRRASAALPRVTAVPAAVTQVLVPAPAPDQMILIHGEKRTVTVFGKEGDVK